MKTILWCAAATCIALVAAPASAAGLLLLAGAMPEPASWALFVGSFGTAGLLLRSQAAEGIAIRV